MTMTVFLKFISISRNMEYLFMHEVWGFTTFYNNLERNYQIDLEWGYFTVMRSEYCRRNFHFHIFHYFHLS